MANRAVAVHDWIFRRSQRMGETEGDLYNATVAVCIIDISCTIRFMRRMFQKIKHCELLEQADSLKRLRETSGKLWRGCEGIYLQLCLTSKTSSLCNVHAFRSSYSLRIISLSTWVLRSNTEYYIHAGRRMLEWSRMSGFITNSTLSGISPCLFVGSTGQG